MERHLIDGTSDWNAPGAVTTALATLRRHPRAAAAAAVTVVAAVLALVLLTTELYAARADVLITDPSTETVFETGAAGFRPGDSDREIATQMQLAGSPLVADRAAVSSPEIDGVPVTVTQVGDTFVLSLTAVDEDPHLAAAAAQAHAEAYVTERRAQFVDGINSARSTLEAKIADIDAELAALEAALPAATGDAAANLAANMDALRAQRREFSNRASELEVDANLTSIGATVIRRATAPTAPSVPDRNKATAAAIAGSALAAFAAAFAADRFRDQVGTTDRAREIVAPATVVASIAEHSGDHLLRDGGDHHAEGYRLLRVSVGLLHASDGPTVIMVTSATPGDGKTVTSANLAMAFAQSGKRTLLVDGDMRRGRLRALFAGRREAPGVLAALAGDVEAPLAARATAVSDLFLLDLEAYPPNPSKLISNGAFDKMVAALRDSFDVVIVDAPPILAAADAVMLAASADVTLFVVDRDSRRRAVLEAFTRLRAAGVDNPGVVVNRVGGSDESYYGYSYTAPPKGTLRHEP